MHSNEQNRNKLRDIEIRLRAVRGEEVWGLGEKSEGIKKYIHRDVHYRVENIVNNIVINYVWGRWVLETSGYHFVRFMIV